MAEKTDPKILALRLAVARWKKFPDDPIAKELDTADEWIREAMFMNKFLPGHVFKAGFAWQNVHPVELKLAAIKTVKMYADFVEAHIKPLVVPAKFAETVAGASAQVFHTATAPAPEAGVEVTPSRALTTRFFAEGAGLNEDDIAALVEAN